MKTQFRIRLFTAAFLLSGTMAVAGMQNDPVEEVPGDNFSLEGALELFKKSASPQEFEQLLNSPNSKVNNLDLNGDGEIDYIRVIDRNEGNVHAFIMQALVSNNESQDIAVIELEKRADGSAVLQIVGDADIYGIETIIEPTQEVRVNAGASTARTVVNVWAWPSVQYVYSPYYSVWVSPWGWRTYPVWYRPWRPIAWAVYDPFWAPYRPYYSFCYSHRVVYAPRMYRPYRSTSVIVYNRHYTQINHYRSSRGNDYASGYRNDRSGDHRNGRYDNSQRSSDNRYSNSRSNSSRQGRYENGRSGSNDVQRYNGQNGNRTRSTMNGRESNDGNTIDRSGSGQQRTSRFGDNGSQGNPANQDRSVDRQPTRTFRRSEPTTMNRERAPQTFSRPSQSQRSGNNEVRSMPSQSHQRSMSPSGGGGGQRQPSIQRSNPGGGGRSGGNAPSGGSGGGGSRGGGSRGRHQ
jgi:hypothetical protein